MVVNVNDRVSGDNRVVAVHAGLAGVAQDEDGALQPVAGWHLSPAARRSTMGASNTWRPAGWLSFS